MSFLIKQIKIKSNDVITEFLPSDVRRATYEKDYCYIIQEMKRFNIKEKNDLAIISQLLLYLSKHIYSKASSLFILSTEHITKQPHILEFTYPMRKKRKVYYCEKVSDLKYLPQVSGMCYCKEISKLYLNSHNKWFLYSPKKKSDNILKGG